MTEAKRILLINDDESISRYLREKLTTETGYDVFVEMTAQGGLSSLRQNSFDIIITKFGMRDLGGLELIESLKKIDSDSVIIVYLEKTDEIILKETTKLGVYDFITKPINIEKLYFLIKKGNQLHSMAVANKKLIQNIQEQNLSLKKQNILLAKRIEESTKNLTRLYGDLRLTYMRTIKVLAQAIDARDHYTHSHSQNVAKYSVAIAEEMGLTIKEIEIIREACELHDLGKIGVEDSILSKPSGLTAKEWEQIKRHPQTAVQILEPLTFLNDVMSLVAQHHERYDGSGYPQGLKAEGILLGARIINLADSYDAMRSARAYRKIPLSKEEATLEIKKNSGKQFDPKVVEAFLKVVDNL